MKKYAFFLDLDGTSAIGGEIPPENVEAINEAIEGGHYVFICTGRSLPFIGDKILNAASWSGVISSIGAEIIMNGKILRKNFVSDAFAKKAVNAILNYNSFSLIGNGRDCIAVNHTEKTENWVYIDRIEDFTEDLREITKIDLLYDVPEEVVEILSEEMDVIRHKDYCEATKKGNSKSEGIRFVLEKLGLPKECSVAIGDSNNDLDMIKYAGIGVAMDNATDEIKNAADMITAHCCDFGVAKAIREIIGK